MWRAIFAGLILALSFGQHAAAAEKVFADDGAAIRGYDPVAYHLDGAPVKGDARYAWRWKDHDWYFVSAANRDLFAADPERYAPAYNGFCAYAASRGYTAPTAPEAWTIRDGRLFLNYSLSVRDDWLEDIDANIAAGDRNWPKLSEP